jgi:hypothetical protein
MRNFTGLPAASTRCGFSGDGLPLGLQIVGRTFDEATVLRIADAYARATDWLASANLFQSAVHKHRAREPGSHAGKREESVMAETTRAPPFTSRWRVT